MLKEHQVSQIPESKDKVTRFECSQRTIAEIIAHEIVVGAENPTVREFTINLLKGRGITLYPFSFAQLETIYDYVNKQITYVKDIRNTETLYSAVKILKNGFGDCDDKTTLSGSMLRTLGYDVGIVYVDLLNSGDFQHIYLVVFTDKGAVPFDATLQNGRVGMQVATYYRKRIMPIL